MGHGRGHHTADSLSSHDKILSRQNETVHERKQGVLNSVRLEEGTPQAGIHNQNPAEGAVQIKTVLPGRTSSQGGRSVLAQQQLRDADH